MIINSNNYSIQIAVIAFFITTGVGTVFRLAPLTCSKRALICACIAYILSRCTIKVINKIILNALIKSQISKQEESYRGNIE